MVRGVGVTKPEVSLFLCRTVFPRQISGPLKPSLPVRVVPLCSGVGGSLLSVFFLGWCPAVWRSVRGLKGSGRPCLVPPAVPVPQSGRSGGTGLWASCRRSLMLTADLVLPGRLISEPSLIESVLVFCGCCNAVPRTGWLQTIEMYRLTVLEA